MKVTIIDLESNLREVDLGQYNKEKIVMGRMTEMSDLVLSDSVVSRIQGFFYVESDKVTYQDAGSRNGTFVGKKHLFQSNRIVEIHDQTVMRIGNPQNPNKMVLLLFHRDKSGKQWGKISNQERVTIGRGKDNVIVLKHPGVSVHHAVIEKRGMHTILTDIDSTNGVMVNGESVNGSVRLSDKDVIQILGFQMLYSADCIYYKAEAKGISVRVRNVTKIVGKGKKKKKILDNVNLDIEASEFVAIIGGSGAGKTTLMNAISGFEPTFSGNVFCNGIDLIKQFQNLKTIIGFVPQQDIIYENLTLRRMLEYTAKMKMQKDVTKKEIRQRIHEVLEIVDLTNHAETYIRKLSGGQKKRASIAVELLADPDLFFLDEPTSGLDPGTEKSLMHTLSKLAHEKHKTIIMVTHTTANLHLCDKVIFMGAGGRLCHYGNVEKTKRFFDKDDLVDIYNEIAERPAFWAKKYDEESKSQLEKPEEASKSQRIHKKSKKGVSPIKQYMVLTQRYGELMLRDTPKLLTLLLQPLLIALLLKVVADEHVFSIYESTKSMLFALSCSAIWIGLFDSIQEICKERTIVKREYMANLNLGGYMMSKFTLQTLLSGMQAALLSFVFLLLVDGNGEGLLSSSFRLDIFITIWLTILTSVTMGFVISAYVKSGDKAMAIAPFVLIVQLLFSGILFQLSGMGKWISYITVNRWSVEGLGSISELNNLELKLQKDYPMLVHEAEDFFEATVPHLLQCWTILAGMMVFCMIVSVIVLRNVAKDTR